MSYYRPTIHYSIIQALYYCLYATTVSSSSLFLIYKGFSNFRIGQIIALGGLVSALVQPILGRIADSAERSILRRLISINCCLCILLVFLILSPLAGHNLTAVLYIVLIASVQSIIPMCSALAMFFSGKGINVDFGIGRGFGSLGFSVCMAIVGSLAAIYSPKVCLYGALISMVLLIGFTQAFRFKGVSEENYKPVVDQEYKGNFFKENRAFIPVMIGVMLIIINSTTYSNFMLQIVTSKGGTSADMGRVLGIAAFLEVPPLLFFHSLNRRFPSGVLLRFSTLFFLLKATLMLLAPSMPLFYLAQLCQMPGYGLYCGASVYYVNNTIKRSSQVQGQAYLNMMQTAASIVGSLAGGWMLDRASANVLIICCLCCGVVGTIILQLSVKRGLKFGEEQ